MNENEILESCLESLKKGASLASCLEQHPELSDESLLILQAAVRLQTAGRELTPDPAFKRRARGSLMQRIAAEQREAVVATASATPSLRQQWQAFLARFSSPGLHWQPLAAAVALALFFALSVGVLAAARKAQPGDLLYPVKQLTEQLNAITGREATPPAATPPPTASPPPTRIHPMATSQIAPETPASSPPTATPTAVLPTEPPVTPTTFPETPVPPTATHMPPTPTMVPTMPPHPTRTPMPGPAMSPTTPPTMPPTQSPPTMPPATATSMPPTPTMPMPTPTAAPPTATMPPTSAPPTATTPPTATPVPAPTMNPTQSPPTPPSWP